MTEKVLGRDTKEFKNLKMAAGILTSMSDSEDIEYVVKDCYFDLGLDWMWTTILKINYKETGVLRSCQAVNSRDWKLIVGANSKEDLLEIMKNIVR